MLGVFKGWFILGPGKLYNVQSLSLYIKLNYFLGLGIFNALTGLTYICGTVLDGTCVD